MNSENLFAAHQKDEFAARLHVREQRIAGLFGKRLEVANGARIGCHDAQYFAALQFRQGFFRLEDRQRAVQFARIEFHVEFHDFVV